MRGPWIGVVVTAVVATEPGTAQQAELPRFSDHLVTDTLLAESAAPDLTSPESRRFRSVLTMAAEGGPNFAGHYTVAFWGCGTSCQSFAIIDAKTGAVTLGGFTLSVGAAFRRDSGLFIANPSEAWREAYGEEAVGSSASLARTEYYRWDGERLVLLACMALGENSRC